MANNNTSILIEATLSILGIFGSGLLLVALGYIYIKSKQLPKKEPSYGEYIPLYSSQYCDYEGCNYQGSDPITTKV